jgi:16S rRNA (cytosine1402-N4)-methyltransferase
MADLQLQHKPVLFSEVIDLLNIRGGRTWVDATAGGGGHLGGIIEQAGPDSMVIGIDRDQLSLNELSARFSGSFIPIYSNYSELDNVLRDLGIDTVSGGILADLGLSSLQLDDPARGFSFTKDGPLDMRMDTSSKITAADLVNNLEQKELADLIFKYGEERYSRKIAAAIVKARPIMSTLMLAEVVSASISRNYKNNRKGRIHPATRTFQALRIALNNELTSLEKFLHSAIKLLSPGARLVVISFHSLEDRLVKQIFKQGAASCVCPPRNPVCTCGKQKELQIITRKPVVPNEQEVLANPRSRSAKLRCVEKL